MAYTWFLQCGWLPMATNYDWLGDVHWISSGCNGDGRSWPAVPFVHAQFHCYRYAWFVCHRSRRGSKLSILETHRYCDALTELILTHCTAGRVSLCSPAFFIIMNDLGAAVARCPRLSATQSVQWMSCAACGCCVLLVSLCMIHSSVFECCER